MVKDYPPILTHDVWRSVRPMLDRRDHHIFNTPLSSGLKRGLVVLPYRDLSCRRAKSACIFVSDSLIL